MYTTTSILASATLLLTSAVAQSATPTPAPTTSSSDTAANVDNLVNYLLPSASITSLSPSQQSQVAHDASAFFNAYTASHPLSALEANAALDVLLGATSTPSPAQEASIEALLAAAPTAVVADPSGYVASVDGLVSPYAFAGAVSTYAEGLIDGLRTVVASDVGQPVPTQASAAGAAAGASSANVGPRGHALPTALVGAMAGVAVGAVGVAMI